MRKKLLLAELLGLFAVVGSATAIMTNNRLNWLAGGDSTLALAGGALLVLGLLRRRAA